METIKFSELGRELQSFVDYGIEFENEELVKQAETQYPFIFRKVTDKSGILNLKNFTGVFEFLGKSIKVSSSKIDPKDYEKMLYDIVEGMAQLPFDFNTPTYERFEIKDIEESSVLYHVFLIIKHILMNPKENMEDSFESIVSNPIRREERIDIKKDVWDASNISFKTIEGIVNSPSQLVLLQGDNPLGNTALAQAIYNKSRSQYFPTQVIEPLVIRGFDGPENRFIKYFISLCIEIIECFQEYVLHQVLAINKNQLLIVCGYMLEKLEEMYNHQMLREVGQMKYLPFNSISLQKREGYKNFLKFYNMVYSSIHILFDERKSKLIIENKDIAQLYEIWTFIKMIDVVGKCIEQEPISALKVKTDEVRANIGYGIRIKYLYRDEEVSLSYNRTFRKGEKASYSLTLRPDIVLEIGEARYIFDAKFKIQKIEWDQSVIDEEKEDESFTFKNGDIYKMHTYKDAIKGVKFACVLYPNPIHENIDFFEEEAGSSFGVGAIPLMPGKGNDNLIRFLNERCFKGFQ
ncbi:PD-(D/E)XK nuclease superfamily protein [Natronincola peptidivorans]|uniref:PD-(D/E)XK nuclease superfamily protein n=1 Tax=Natronincola peptidivorans TaxID=426128 RepID=A0A1I0EL86_9FIRM|nr:DUF2357 domain-containing protein [Natronincola peptidivorans]SET45481.1 PD-(D/E)XK nuclease superfamily protein [Natronincola peptidivorans]